MRTPSKIYAQLLSIALIALCVLPQHARAGASYLDPDYNESKRPAYDAQGKRFAVSSQGLFASQAAKDIYKKSGNLIDAAVAASFVLAVERPHSTGLGGGGFMLIRLGQSGRTYAVDFRERAPLKATRDMFLDSNGEVVADKSVTGELSVATPGFVAGLLDIHSRFGKLPLAKVLAPAIELAENGFSVYPRLAQALNDEKDVLSKFPDSKKIFFKPDGGVLLASDRLVQKDLAQTLRLIAKEGKNGFYRGAVADAIVKEMKTRQGLITKADLTGYRTKWPEPLTGTYNEYDIISMPPPSSGGVHILQILNMTEADPLRSLGFHTAESVHLLASAMQTAFADRAVFLGDPAFTRVPTKGLTSKMYAGRLRASIPFDHARTADKVSPGDPWKFEHMSKKESKNTTHLSLMDSAGNMVSTTQTINGFFGSGLVAEGTGVLLNNEMDDFSAKPGAANIYGAVGAKANSVQPLKTPLSSMSPTLVLVRPLNANKKGSSKAKPYMAVGAPGGTRIITCVTQVLINHLGYDMPLFDAISAPRFHQQWRPDKLDIEDGFSSETKSGLKNLGHNVNEDEVHCRVMAVGQQKSSGPLNAASDPRDYGSALAF